MGIASLLAGAIRPILHGVVPHDPVTLLTTTGVVFRVTLLAVFVPVVRVLSVDAAETLQAD